MSCTCIYLIYTVVLYKCKFLGNMNAYRCTCVQNGVVNSEQESPLLHATRQQMELIELESPKNSILTFVST